MHALRAAGFADEHNSGDSFARLYGLQTDVTTSIPFTGRRRLPASFIKRCWFKRRGCLESSTCTSMRQLFKEKEVVDELPLHSPECKTPIYISTGIGMHARRGYIDRNRLETLEFPGEKWHKCCKRKGATPDDDDKLICAKVDVLDSTRLVNDFNGWCGKHKCINPRDRCLKVGVKEEILKHPRGKNKCPTGCSGECKKSTFHLECIYTGVEPKFGTEGKATPTAAFGGPEKYQVFSIASVPLPPLVLLALPAAAREAWRPSGASPPACGGARNREWVEFLFAVP